jgi:hypothetical protein
MNNKPKPVKCKSSAHTPSKTKQIWCNENNFNPFVKIDFIEEINNIYEKQTNVLLQGTLDKGKLP